MKRINITGIELVENEVVVRTVTETKRFYHRRIHYKARVYAGDYGNWRVKATGKRAPKNIWKILDEAYLRAINAAGEGRHAGYDGEQYQSGAVRHVSRPTGA